MIHTVENNVMVLFEIYTVPYRKDQMKTLLDNRRQKTIMENDSNG